MSLEHAPEASSKPATAPAPAPAPAPLRVTLAVLSSVSLLLGLLLLLRYHMARVLEAPEGAILPGRTSNVSELAAAAATTKSRHSPLPLPAADRAHKCHIVGHDPALSTDWAFNTRAFCLTSAVCVRGGTRAVLPHLYIGADPAASECVVDHPTLRPLAAQPPIDCASLQTRQVHCAHGKYVEAPDPECPVTRRLRELHASENATLRWRPEDELAVIVPALPFSRNIFHFAYIAATVGQLVRRLPALQHDWLASGDAHDAQHALADTRLRVVLRGTGLRRYGPWHHVVFDAVLAPARARYRSVQVTVLRERARRGVTSRTNIQQGICFRRAVLLDARREVKLWPFANGSAVSHAGRVVPAHSVLFRHAVFDRVGLHSALPARLPAHGARAVFPLPPRALGYSRREMARGVRSNIPRGFTRRFVGDSEEWLRGMLRAEAARAGASFTEFKPRASDSMRSQVACFNALGVLIGIHGSNLSNALFMRPFGAIVELFPGLLRPDNMPAYVAGLNGGLAYAWHEGTPVSRIASGCRRDDPSCWTHPRGRMVNITSSVHRTAIRAHVAAMLRRINRLHELFPDGIPVRYDSVVGQFVLQDDGALDDAPVTEETG